MSVSYAAEGRTDMTDTGFPICIATAS